MMKLVCLVCKNTCSKIYQNLFDNRYGAFGRYSVYRCNNCGFGRTEPAMSYKEIGKFYAKYYPLNLVTPRQVEQGVNVKPRWWVWVTGSGNIAHWLIKPKSTVLDVGSASGVSLLEIRKLGGVAFGVEPDPNAQKIAKKLKLQVFKGFITDNLFPNKRFDYITASQVIEHEPDPVGFLEAVSYHLNQKGKVILSFPNGDSLYRKIFGKLWINWHVPYHINHFTRKSFIYLSEQTGFRIVKIATVTPNLWTLLQFRMLFSGMKEGEKSSIWLTSQYADTNKQNSLLLKFGVTLLKLLVIIVIIPITVINRIVDLFGQGDSFILILEREYAK